MNFDDTRRSLDVNCEILQNDEYPENDTTEACDCYH